MPLRSIELSSDMESCCRAELWPDEQIIWIGAPLPSFFRERVFSNLVAGVMVGIVSATFIYCGTAGLSVFHQEGNPGAATWISLVIGVPLALAAAMCFLSPV